MSFNELILPAPPQAPAAGLNGPHQTGSASCQSSRPDDSAVKGRSFMATLHKISNNSCDRSSQSTGAENTADISDHADTATPLTGEMNKSNDHPQAGVEDSGGSESAQTAACIHPLHAYGLIQQQFFNILMSATGSFASANHLDSTAAKTLPLFDSLAAQLPSEGAALQNGQVGIGLFEQLQANVSPQATNLYYFEQLAAGAFNHQDGSGAMGWGYRSWMMTLSAGNLNAQVDALESQVKPLLPHLLHAQGLNAAVLESAAQSDGSGAQKSAAHLPATDLNGEFLLKMSAQSQQGGLDKSENTQTAVAGNTAKAGFSSLAAGIHDSKITAETKLPHETKNAHMHRPQAAEKPADQTANSKFAAEVAVTKPLEESVNSKGGVIKNQMPFAAESVDKVIQIEGENKGNSLLYGQDQMSEKLAKFEPATPTSESAQRSLSSQAMNQIVQKAVLSFNNGQNEIRIELKPEFLGHIRMQIVTDNQQVAVKILAESPFTKDMLESNLNQLKADLQAQGLKVDQLDVSVAHDSHSGANNQTAAQKSKSSALRGEEDSAEDPSAESLESQAGASETTAENAIDFFA